MSQQECLDFLREKKDNNRWYTSKQIASGLKKTHGTIIVNMMRLRNSGFVRFKEVVRARFAYKYREK